jgi:hypothetical protein
MIRNWAGEPDKVVLQPRWVDICISQSAAALQDQDWAGCIAVDDGLASDEDEEDEVNEVVRCVGEGLCYIHHSLPCIFHSAGQLP